MQLFLRTFGGLKFSYYLGNLVFAIIIAALQHNYQGSAAGQSTGAWQTATFSTFSLIANTCLYPYSRFAYQSFVDALTGANIFVISLKILLPFKLFSMYFCWFLALLLAPIGLVILWFHHAQPAATASRSRKSESFDDW